MALINTKLQTRKGANTQALTLERVHHPFRNPHSRGWILHTDIAVAISASACALACLCWSETTAGQQSVRLFPDPVSSDGDPCRNVGAWATLPALARAYMDYITSKTGKPPRAIVGACARR